MLKSLTGFEEKMIGTLAQTNTGAGDKTDAQHHNEKNEPTNFPETNETGEFDFASLAFTPLASSKLTDQQKLHDHTQSEERSRGSEGPEGNTRMAYGYVIKQRRQENRQPQLTSQNGLNQSLQPETKPTTSGIVSKPIAFASTRSAPSLDMLRANLAKSTPMTAPKIDRRQLEPQTLAEHPQTTASNKDPFSIKRVPSVTKSLTSPTTLQIPRVVPQHPRIQIIQRQSGLPAKPVSTGHRLPQLIYEPRSGKQIAQPAHRATQSVQQSVTPGVSTQHHQQPVYTRVYHIPYNYSHQYFPSTHNIMTSSHSMKSKDSPVARYDQPPSSHPQVSYSASHSLDQPVQQSLTTPYRITADQTNRIKQQMFSSLPVSDRKTLPSKIHHQSRPAAENFKAPPGSMAQHSQNPSLAPLHSSAHFSSSDGRTHSFLASGTIQSSNSSLTQRHLSRNLPPIYSRYTHASDQNRFRPSGSMMSQQVVVSPNIRREKGISAFHGESNMHRSRVPPGPQLNFNNDGRFTDKSRCTCAERRNVLRQTTTGDRANANSANSHLETPSRRMPLLLPQNSSLRSEAAITPYEAKKFPLGNEFPSDTYSSTTQVIRHSTPQSHSIARQYSTSTGVDHCTTEKTAVTSHQDAIEKSSSPVMSSKETNNADIQKSDIMMKCKHGRYIQVQPSEAKETSNAPTNNLVDNVDNTNSSDKVNKVRKLIVQCPSTVDARREKDVIDDDEDDRERRHKITQEAPLFKKALKMLQNQRRILAKPGHVVSGPVPPEEITCERPLKPKPKTKSRENLIVKDNGANNDKGKTKSRKKFKIRRNLHDGKKRFASMSRKKHYRGGEDSNHCKTNKSGKCSKETEAEGPSRSLNDWLVDDDENNDDIKWYCDFKKSADICNQRREARGRVTHESSEKTVDQDKQCKLSTTEHKKDSTVSAHHRGSKVTKKKASKRRKITKSKNKVSPRSKTNKDATEEKKNSGSGRRMTLTSLSAMAWEECREITMEQWLHCAEEKGLPRKEIDGIVACNKQPEIAIEKQNGPPDFQELLVKTWQGVMVMSEQKIETADMSNNTLDVKCEPSEEKHCLSKTPLDDDKDEYVDVVGTENQMIGDEHDAKSAFDVFVKNVIDNAERECDLPISEDHTRINQERTYQDWNTWEQEVNGNQLLQVKEGTKSSNTQDAAADDEVAAITAMVAPLVNRNNLDEQTEQNTQEIHQGIEKSQIPRADLYNSNNVVNNQSNGYNCTQWNVDVDTEGYFVHNNEVIYVDDQSWIGEITEVVETCNNETEVIKVCEKAIECASKT